MNERFKELMVELKKTVSTERGAEVLIGYDEIEAFAELIVKECSSICQNVGDTLWAEQYQSNIGTARTCMAAIREHFGVQE